MKYLIFIFSIALSFGMYAQKDCKVLVKELTGVYQGGCKKGLAHGKGKAVGTDTYSGKFKKGYPNGRGTYTYASGDVYIGEFEEGRRHGKGKYEFKVNGQKTIKEGFWEDDVYIGPKKIRPYKVIRNRNLERYSFQRINEGDDIKVEFLQNGRTNPSISDLIIQGSSGDELPVTSVAGWKNVTFPFKGNIRYRTQNKLRTSEIEALFEFEIIKPGKWKVIIYN